jgi:hypothetical protein
MFEIEHTDEFEEWWNDLSEKEQKDLAKDVMVLGQLGPSLGRPRVDSIKNSDFKNMKELRTQSGGSPIRTFFAFDPRRSVILLIGGDKTGDDKFYDKMIPIADKLYREHLKEIENG